MKKTITAKWMALLIAGSCVGCSTTSGAKSPGFFASWTNPFATTTAANPQKKSDEKDDVIRLDKKPNATADFFIAAGKLADSRGDMQTAVAQYQHAIKKEPKNVNAHLHLARLHERMQNYPEAEQMYLAAAEAGPTDPTPLNDLGLCLARQQRFDEAIEKLNKAIAMKPHQTVYRNNIAKILVKTGRPREAYEHLARVHSVGESHYNLGFMLKENGEFGPAREHLVAAIQVDPNLDAAHDLLAEMGGAAPQTANRPESRPAATKEVSAPRYMRAQGASKQVIESDEMADEVDTESSPVAPKGYYDGVEEGEESSAPPAEVLAKRQVSKPAKKTGKKSAAALRAKIEDSEPVLR